MAVITYETMINLTDLSFREIVDKELADPTDMISTFYTVKSSDQRTEKVGTTGENPMWEEFTGQMPYARFHQGYTSTATHRQFVQAMMVTRDMFDDDQTGIVREGRYRKMVSAGNQTRQTHAARVFNSATSNDSYFYTWSEGVPLGSTAHTTTVPGVSTATGFSNLTTDAASPTSYRAARIMMNLFRNDQGDLCNIDGDLVLCSVSGRPRWEEILKTTKGLDTPYGNVNPEANSAQLMSWNRITGESDWFLLNKAMMKESMIWWERVAREYENIKDFETKQLKSSGYGRWSVMVYPEWRFIVVNKPT